MYIPDLYKNENAEEIQNFLRDHGFAVLISQANTKLLASHIPLVLDINTTGAQVLIGHLSKLNPQASNFTNDAEVLAVFSGPHAYVSSSWYDHENVPTWNYIAVHVYGTVRLYNEEETITSLKKLVDRYEINSVNPVRVEELSERTMREAKGIVAFEIAITSLEAVKKLSQNRDAKNHQNIVTELEKTNDSQAIAVAEAMKKNRPSTS
jgi:transcriptional regulator